MCKSSYHKFLLHRSFCPAGRKNPNGSIIIFFKNSLYIYPHTHTFDSSNDKVAFLSLSSTRFALCICICASSVLSRSLICVCVCVCAMRYESKPSEVRFCSSLSCQQWELAKNKRYDFAFLFLSSARRTKNVPRTLITLVRKERSTEAAWFFSRVPRDHGSIECR